MPPENILPDIHSSFGGNESAVATDFGMTRWTEPTGHITAYDYPAGPLDHFQISDMPQDCVPGPFLVVLHKLKRPAGSSDKYQPRGVAFPLQSSMVSFSVSSYDLLSCMFWSRIYDPPRAVAGGFPCGPCLKILGKSRIWATPCTKAQFLDSIEAGSSFPSLTMQEITLFKNPVIRSMMMLMVQLAILPQQEEGQCAVVQSIPLGQTCKIPWAIGGWALLSILADLSEDPRNWTRPSFSKVASKLADWIKESPSGAFVKLFNKTEELHTPDLAGSAKALCLSSSYRQPPQFTCDSALLQLPGHDAGSLTSSLVFWTGWVASRCFGTLFVPPPPTRLQQYLFRLG
ncbi:hypothetical protein ACJZ2D_005541 [Fusarium nematophilum]